MPSHYYYAKKLFIDTVSTNYLLFVDTVIKYSIVNNEMGYHYGFFIISITDVLGLVGWGG